MVRHTLHCTEVYNSFMSQAVWDAGTAARLLLDHHVNYIEFQRNMYCSQHRVFILCTLAVETGTALYNLFPGLQCQANHLLASRKLQDSVARSFDLAWADTRRGIALPANARNTVPGTEMTHLRQWSDHAMRSSHGPSWASEPEMSQDQKGITTCGANNLGQMGRATEHLRTCGVDGFPSLNFKLAAASELTRV
eukprot:413280-Rhodomonas_salina.1